LGRTGPIRGRTHDDACGIPARNFTRLSHPRDERELPEVQRDGVHFDECLIRSRRRRIGVRGSQAAWSRGVVDDGAHEGVSFDEQPGAERAGVPC
jgi:hypothetical protein